MQLKYLCYSFARISNVLDESHPLARFAPDDQLGSDLYGDVGRSNRSLSVLADKVESLEASVAKLGAADEDILKEFENSVMFLRQQLMEIEKEHSKLSAESKTHQPARIIQRWYRCQKARSSFIKLRKSVTVIQTRYRGARDRKAYCQKQSAAIIIQSFVRMLIRRMEFLLHLECLEEPVYYR